MTPPRQWQLKLFEHRLDEWIELEDPTPDLRIAVLAWVQSRFDDPYQGVDREPGFPNLWFGVVPGTGHGDHFVVCCSYWIEEAEHSVRCDSIATLSYPA